MTGAYVAGDIRRRILGQVLAFNDRLFRDVLKAFDNLEERSNEQANDFYQNYPCDEYTDPGDVADWAQDHSLAWYETMTSLRQSMRNLLAAGLFHMVEQQLAALSLDCGYERVRNTGLFDVKAWYQANLGIDLASLAAWPKIDEMRLVANAVKHAEGKSAKDLRAVRPDLFSNPDFAELRAEWEKHGMKEEQKPLFAPISGEDLFVTERDLSFYADAARTLFEGIIEFCEQHRDDRFPLGA